MKFNLNELRLYISIFLIILFLSSCHENNKNIEQDIYYNMYKKELIQSININSDIYNTETIEFCDYKDNQIGYKVTVGDISDGNEEIITKDEYYILDTATNEIKNCICEEHYVDYYFRNPDNTITEIYKENNTDVMCQNYHLKKINNEDVICDTIVVCDEIESICITDVVHDNEYIYVLHENEDKISYLLVYDYNYKLINTYKQNDTIKCIENPINGCMFVLNNGIYSFTGDKNKFDKISNIMDDSNQICSGDTLYDYYISKKDYTNGNVNEKFLMGFKNNIYSKLFSYDEMGMTDAWEVMFPDNEGGFFAYRIGDMGNYDIYHLKLSDKKYSVKDNKKVIKIATCSDYESEYVLKFNEQSDEYYAEVVEYFSDENFEDSVKKLILDSQSSDDIDLIYMNGLDTELFVQKGIIENLNLSYFDKDGNISKNDFSSIAIEAMTQQDGGIYSIFNEYSISGLWGKKTFDKTKLWNSSYNAKNLLISNAELNTFCDVINYSGDEYISLTKKTTNFNDDFKYLLQLFKAQIENKDLINQEDYRVLVKEQKADLLYANIHNPYDYYLYTNVFNGEYNNYIHNGIPILVPGMTELSVSNNSKNKEGAYEFLNFVFDYKNYYYISNSASGFPTLKLNEEDWKQRLIATKDYYNKYGELINAHDFLIGIGGFSCEISAVSEEDYRKLEQFINSAEYVKPLPSKYMGIILEEAELYFEDKKSLDDTVKAIENRVTNALNE